MKRARIVPSRLPLAGVVFATILLGNLRAHASVDVSRKSGAALQSAKPVLRIKAPSALPIGSEQAGQLIPAVFAWDPNVRFVYDRHVSRWM